MKSHQSRRSFLLTPLAYQLLLAGCVLVISGCGSARAQSDSQTGSGWGGSGGSGQVNGAVATLVVPEFNTGNWGSGNGANWPGQDGNWANSQLTTPEWGQYQSQRLYEAVPAEATPAPGNLVQGFVDLASGNQPTTQPLPPTAEVIIMQPTAVIPPTAVPQLQVQPAQLQPVSQEPVQGNANCTCVSQYAMSVGNPNTVRQCGVMLPGDESMCTPNGWVYVGPQR